MIEMVTSKSLGVKVPLHEAESTRKKLIELRMLDQKRKIKRMGGYAFLPVTRVPKGFSIVETDFEEVEEKKSFKEKLREILPAGKTITSYDIIGDIAVIEIPQGLEEYERRIAELLLSSHKHIRSVYEKKGEVEGLERVRTLKFLTGEDNPKTIHKEHGILLKLDISKVYFSPRLSYERERVLKQVKDGEVIVDLFAGVGPFSILLAKYRRVKVYAIDINPYAYEYLKENIRINKVANKVIPLLGDCRELAPRNIADRVIMNLPKSAHEFLDLSFQVVKEGIIHFYSISPKQDLYSRQIELIREIGRKTEKEVNILGKRIVRPYSPYNYHIVIDIGVK
jgi:tRNA (guanine37-N1)-methyltransferase